MAKKKNTTDRKVQDIIVRLQQQTECLTRNDLRRWRTAWQQAINVEHPNRIPLLNIYTDVAVDLHLSGCVEQRSGFILSKRFKLVDATGTENEEITALFRSPWFTDLLTLLLDSRYYGHSLVELGNVVESDGKPTYSGVTLVPRRHVIPEYGVIVPNAGDSWRAGFDYRNSELSNWCIEAGGTHSLGLYHKCAQQTIPKKNMCAFWDMFGEIFGMPLRVATTTSRSSQEQDKIERMLRDMGAAAYALFPEGTTVDIKESTRGDAYNVYDRRIERCNSEISKGILTVTMTIDNGSSHSQSEVHERMLENLINKDATFLRHIINWQLIPRMIRHGFPVAGYRFEWDEGTTYTPEQQLAYERFVAGAYDVDATYFAEKYNMPAIRKADAEQLLVEQRKKAEKHDDKKKSNNKNEPKGKDENKDEDKDKKKLNYPFFD